MRELKADGVAARTVYPEVSPKVEYSLTIFGKTLAPVLEVLRDRGSNYLEKIVRIRRDRSQTS